MSEFKQKGNEAMARNDYGAAVTFYTKGVDALTAASADAAEVKAQLHILYSNRAQGLINVRKYADAAEDCKRAIECNPAFLKSYLRRATANVRLGALDAAAADLTTLKAQPPSDLAANGLDACVIDAVAEELSAARIAAVATAPLTEKASGEQWIKGYLSEASAASRRFLLPSGVACEILTAGKGATSPIVDTPCKVHYEGSLRDGSVFDSSVARGQPATFAPSDVIAGWTEVLQYMVEGDKWDVLIPGDKAYGKRGSPPVIPGNATLRFSIELVEVMGKITKPAAKARDLLKDALSGRDIDTLLPAA